MATKRDSMNQKIHKSDLVINAVNFLKTLQEIESNNDLIEKMNTSKAAVSRAMQPGTDDVSEVFLLKFEKIFLRPLNYVIEDFADMKKLLGLKGRVGRSSVDSMLTTKVTRVEGMGETILDKLDELLKEIRRVSDENEALREENKALTKRLATKTR